MLGGSISENPRIALDDLTSEYNKLVNAKNKNPLGKPTTIDDISKKYKVTAEDSKVKLLLMKNKMGGNTKKK
jgi:hypothetical protein